VTGLAAVTTINSSTSNNLRSIASPLHCPQSSGAFLRRLRFTTTAHHCCCSAGVDGKCPAIPPFSDEFAATALSSYRSCNGLFACITLRASSNGQIAATVLQGRGSEEQFMTRALSPGSVAQHEERHLPFERVVLVLQGGGALGAYQAGVYAALAEANIHLDWVCGISIGAINAALIVGNPPSKRVEKLREFWEAVTEPPINLPGLPWFSDLLSGNDDQARLWSSKMSALTAMIYGAPHFFSPRLSPPIKMPAESPDGVSYYDTAPLKANLEKLVDFDLINSAPIHLSVGATNVRTGAPVYFDNLERKMTVAHIAASASLPPGFPPTEIDGEYYWDGGVVSNSAVQHVIDSASRHTSLVFQVDLWDANGEVPRDMAAANLRAMEINGASRLNISLDDFRKRQHLRRTIGMLLDAIPQALRDTPEVQMLAEEARVQMGTLVRLKYQAKKYENSSKLFDFSRRTMEDHWQSGYDDMRASLSEPSILELPDPLEAARVFDVHYGWLK
jgi:NTE family protein